MKRGDDVGRKKVEDDMYSLLQPKRRQVIWFLTLRPQTRKVQVQGISFQSKSKEPSQRLDTLIPPPPYFFSIYLYLCISERSSKNTYLFYIHIQISPVDASRRVVKALRIIHIVMSLQISIIISNTMYTYIYFVDLRFVYNR